jgi:hypothetical protein
MVPAMSYDTFADAIFKKADHGDCWAYTENAD